jgi:FeS assembly SUF system protein
MDIDTETRPVPYLVGSETSPLEPEVVEAIRSVYDPEIPVNIFELGLIYDIRIDDEGKVKVVMTLTSPACPVAEEIPNWVKRAIYIVDGVSDVEIELTWEPFWKPDYMAEEARLELGIW